MKLHILSDLHLEFSEFTPHETDANVVVLAGDIGKGAKGIYWAREAFPDKEIVLVAGNHSFYGFDRQETLDLLRKEASLSEVHFLENDSVEIGGVRFLGCTLWTDFKLFGEDKEPQCLQAAQRGLNDFRLIREGDTTFTPKRSQELHNESARWLKHALNEPFEGKTVVVTHHLPSMLSVADCYKNDLLSACFASNLDDMFGKCDLAIHGHTHVNQDYVVEGTRVVCNPRGYVMIGRTENPEFDPSLIVEI